MFASPNGDVTVTVEGNTNPDIATAEIAGDILTITAQSTLGMTMISVMGDDGVMTATDEFNVVVLDPNPNTETLEFTIEDTPEQQNYPNNPNPYDNTYTDLGWTSLTITEDEPIISMHITGDLFSDNYPSEGTLFMTSPDGTTVEILSGFSSGTNAVDIEIGDFLAQSCAGEWIIYFEDSYGDGGHALYNGTMVVEIPGVPNPYEAPTNLAAEVTDDDVHLTWDYGTGGEAVILAWDSGENDDGIGLTNGGSFMVASRWTSVELINYQSMPINTIRIYPRASSATFTLKIWTGDNAGTEVYSQDLTGLTEEAWNDITLDTPHVIDASQELWFGYALDGQLAGEYPAGCDAGPAVAGFGDMISTDGATWDALSGFGLDYNWNIQGVINGRAMQRHSVPETAEFKVVSSDLFAKGNLGATRNRDLTGFKVYRDGAEIAEIMDTDAREYDDMDLADGTYEYYVIAVYDDGESDPSNTVEAIVNTNMELDPPVNLTVTENGYASWFAPGAGGENLQEGFETWPPADWMFMDEDGDTYGWDDGGALGLDAYEGSGLAYSASYINDIGALNPDNWMVTPALQIAGTTEIIYYVCAQDNAWAGEHYGVYISDTGTDPADFDLLFEETMTARNSEKILPKGSRDQGTWYERTVTVEGYSGMCYIAFRHFNCTDMFYLDLDEVTICPATMRPLESYNVYLDGDMITNTTDTFYQFADLVAGTTYEVGVTAVYTEGESEMITTSFTYNPTEADEDLIGVTSLVGNYPNPFNPECTIEFAIAADSPVAVNIYNAKGQHVRTLVNEDMTAGTHQVVWNGKDDNGNNLSSGVYYYKMDSGKYTSSKKMVLMK